MEEFMMAHTEQVPVVPCWQPCKPLRLPGLEYMHDPVLAEPPSTRIAEEARWLVDSDMIHLLYTCGIRDACHL